MRTQGLLSRPAPVGAADHVCWVFDDAASFSAVATRFLTDGLSRGEHLLVVGDPDQLSPALGLPDAGTLVREGRLRLLPVGAAYRRGDPFSPEDQLAFYDGATRAARAAGATGLRVVADVTALAAHPASRADLTRWEHLADDFIASGAGMSAMCGYHRDRLDGDVLAQVTAVHPQVHAPAQPPSFRLWFDSGVLALAGVVDAFTADRLAGLLDDSHVRGPVVRLDVSRLERVDVAGARTLARWAQVLDARSRRLELAGGTRLFRRVWTALDFPDRVPATLV